MKNLSRFAIASLIILGCIHLAPADGGSEKINTSNKAREQLDADRHQKIGSPTIRINTAQHISQIIRIDTDATGDYLVTGSDDNTARIWKLPASKGTSPTLQRVLRPPSGTQEFGGVYAVAMSPGASTVAVGGWSGNYDAYDKDKHADETIFIFDAKSGAVKKTITNLPTRLRDLEFTPDGSLLAAAYDFGRGVELWSTETWRSVAKDQTATDGIWNIALHQTSNELRLATASKDGNVRLYRAAPNGQGLEIINEAPLGQDRSAYGLAFSPNGEFLATSARNANLVIVFSAQDLEPVNELNAEGMWSDLRGLTWSDDGRYLFVGSGVDYDDTLTPPFVRRWDALDQWASEDFAVGLSAIMDLKSDKNGGIIFGATGPELGAIDYSGTKKFFLGRFARWFDWDDETKPVLSNSNDGRTVYLSPLNWTPNDDQFEFQLINRNLFRSLQSEGQLNSPQLSSEKIKITDWYYSDEPKLNGKPIAGFGRFLPWSTSVAVAPDGEAFALGTDDSVRLYGPDGAIIWATKTAAISVYAVNFAPDAKLLVAALGDGTIRWYRLSDGTELLSLFVDADRKHWVLWTTEGYYDASPGGDELIGWHFNQGAKKEALFYNASRLREEYYRPYILSRALDKADGQSLEESPPIIDVLEKLPPLIRILDIAKGDSGKPVLTYEIISPSGKSVTDVRVLIDGRLQKNDGTKSTTRGVRILELSCNKEDSKVALAAKTGVSDYGEIETGDLTTLCQSDPSSTRKLYALVIGVSNYASDGIRDLDFSDDDAHDVSAALLKQKMGNYYSDTIVRSLVDTTATRANILESLTWLADTPNDIDTSLLYITGHGQNRLRPNQALGEIPAGSYYFLPYDAKLDALASTGVGFGSLLDYVRYARGRKLLFLDTCYSGQVDVNGLINGLAAQEQGTIVFASSTGQQTSIERAEWKNGAFTEAFLSGLSGRADSPRRPDGKVDNRELDQYLDEEVRFLTDNRQTPVTRSSAALPSTTIAAVVAP